VTTRTAETVDRATTHAIVVQKSNTWVETVLGVEVSSFRVALTQSKERMGHNFPSGVDQHLMDDTILWPDNILYLSRNILTSRQIKYYQTEIAIH
jgi:hypothetical protein